MEYEQGSKPTFYATFVEHSGTEAVISGTPTITISHRDGVLKETDVDNQQMSILSGSTYYYTWSIPARSDRTIYNAKYHAVYSGVDLTATPVVGADDFQVIPRKFYDKKGGGFVQRLSGEGGWTKKEKEEIFGKVGGLVDNLDSVGAQISGIEIKNYDKELEKLHEAVSLMCRDMTKISEINVKLSEESSKIDEIINKVGSNNKPVNIDLTSVKDSLNSIKSDCEVLSNLETSFSRIGAMLIGFDDISTKLNDMAGKFDGINEMKELYIRTIPTESIMKTISTKKLEEIKNGG